MSIHSHVFLNNSGIFNSSCIKYCKGSISVKKINKILFINYKKICIQLINSEFEIENNIFINNTQNEGGAIYANGNLYNQAS